LMEGSPLKLDGIIQQLNEEATFREISQFNLT
jgi:hypothetical protein